MLGKGGNISVPGSSSKQRNSSQSKSDRARSSERKKKDTTADQALGRRGKEPSFLSKPITGDFKIECPDEPSLRSKPYIGLQHEAITWESSHELPVPRVVLDSGYFELSSAKSQASKSSKSETKSASKSSKSEETRSADKSEKESVPSESSISETESAQADEPDIGSIPSPEVKCCRCRPGARRELRDFKPIASRGLSDRQRMDIIEFAMRMFAKGFSSVARSRDYGIEEVEMEGEDGYGIEEGEDGYRIEEVEEKESETAE